jgi:octanoyl-[GcvH]:protein N-octanoyltransferase
LTVVFPGPFQIVDDTVLAADMRPSPQDYAAWVKEMLSSLQPGDEGILRFRRPRPTAAFSPQDTTHPDYERIKALARAAGFEPVERGTGGRLTMFDEGALAITLLSPHPEPHLHTIKRYEMFSTAIAAALVKLGIDAHVGELPDEYCPGKYSINARGRVKLVGVAQRMNRRCVQMGAIITVQRSQAACDAVAVAYRSMGLTFDPVTYGAIAEIVPTLGYDDVVTVMRESLQDWLRG